MAVCPLAKIRIGCGKTPFCQKGALGCTANIGYLDTQYLRIGSITISYQYFICICGKKFKPRTPCNVHCVSYHVSAWDWPNGSAHSKCGKQVSTNIASYAFRGTSKHTQTLPVLLLEFLSRIWHIGNSWRWCDDLWLTPWHLFADAMFLYQESKIQAI